MRTLHYLMTIEQKYKNFLLLKLDLNKLGSSALDETRDYYLDLNREQMSAGYSRYDERIGVYASPAYERLKASMNPIAGGWVDLKLTGFFQNMMYLKLVSDKKFEVGSQDSKSDELTSKYGDSIFYLSPVRLEEYRTKFFPALMPKIKTLVNGE